MGQLTIEVHGAKKLSRALLRASAATDVEVGRSVRDTTNRAVVIFGRFAPKRTGRLRRGIEGHVRGSSATVTAHARNPSTGYDYVGVSRWGHRKRIIRPKHARALGPIPGIGFRASVKGYRPKKDWSEAALPSIALYARGSLRGAGERILKAV